MSLLRNLIAAAAVVTGVTAAAPAFAPAAAPVDAAGLKKQIAARKGKVVVVNFWATWCGPCVKEFPDLVKLQKSYQAKGVELITISCDESTDLPKVNKFLAKQGITKNAFLNKQGVDIEGYLKYLDPKASDAGIPRTYIFNRSGKLVKGMTGEHSYAEFEGAVKPHLAKK